MKELNLIRLIKGPTGLSSLRGQVKRRMSNKEIDQQISAMHKEWHRDIQT